MGRYVGAYSSQPVRQYMQRKLGLSLATVLHHVAACARSCAGSNKLKARDARHLTAGQGPWQAICSSMHINHGIFSASAVVERNLAGLKLANLRQDKMLPQNRGECCWAAAVILGGLQDPAGRQGSVAACCAAA